ncbi:MAG: GNAT family N-acetyltransferase [Candidatus Latescibacterota bacterium]
MFVDKNGNEIDFETLHIESPRLYLRPVTLDDAQVIFENFTPDITQYMSPPSPKEIEETQTFLRETIAKRANFQELVLAICNRETDEFLGVCGIHQIGEAHPELGIWLKASAHGHRFGREAITALTKWTRQHIRHEYLIYPVDRNKIASRKIPESLDGKIFNERIGKKMDGDSLDLVFYKIPNQ